jgi:hypothetical protein
MKREAPAIAGASFYGLLSRCDHELARTLQVQRAKA